MYTPPKTKKEYYLLIKQSAYDGTFPSIKVHPPLNYYEGVGDNIECRYRGPNNKKCIAGLLIPDSNYRESIEGCTIDLNNTTIDLPKHMNITQIIRLQNIHDKFATKTIWEPEKFMQEIDNSGIFDDVLLELKK